MVSWRQPDARRASDPAMHCQKPAPGSGPFGPLAHASWLGHPAQLAAWPACSCSGPTHSALRDGSMVGSTQPEPKAVDEMKSQWGLSPSLRWRGADIVRLCARRGRYDKRFKGTYVHWRSPARTLLAVRLPFCEPVSTILHFLALPCLQTSHAMHAGLCANTRLFLVRRCACVDLFGSSRRAAAVGHHAARRLLPQLCVPTPARQVLHEPNGNAASPHAAASGSPAPSFYGGEPGA